MKAKTKKILIILLALFLLITAVSSLFFIGLIRQNSSVEKIAGAMWLGLGILTYVVDLLIDKIEKKSFSGSLHFMVAFYLIICGGMSALMVGVLNMSCLDQISDDNTEEKITMNDYVCYKVGHLDSSIERY